MTNSKSAIQKVFRNEENKMREDNKYYVDEEKKILIQENIKKILKILKIKIRIFFLIEIMIQLFFYYYIIAFCEVYKEINLKNGLGHMSGQVTLILNHNY